MMKATLFPLLSYAANQPDLVNAFISFKQTNETTTGTTCSDVLMMYSNNFLSQADSVIHIIRNSGKDYNDYGRYRDCLETAHQQMNYFLVSILDKFPVPLSIGLCLPHPCAVEDLETFKPTLVLFIQSTLPYLFEDVKGFENKNDVTAEDIRIYEPFKENRRATHFGKGSCLTVIIIAWFLLFAMVSTALAWRKKEEELEQDEVSSRTVRPKESKSVRFIKCFNVFENLSAINKPLSKQGDEELEIFNCFRVVACVWVIFGNTYFYVLKSPLQNLEAVQIWIESSIFGLVLSADLVVDVFFWLGAFLASYQMLMRMSIHEGQLPQSKCKIFLNRAMRLLPLYFFTMMFFWKVMQLFGGDGPLFFQYSESAKCEKNFVWHMLFLNNLIPWGGRDACMNWTWYLACDFQFFLLVPTLVNLYYHRRKWFWASILSIWFIALIISVSILGKNDFSASFFTYQDRYWTVFYEKPWARISAYLIGVVWGCTYYSYKHEQDFMLGKKRQVQDEGEEPEERTRETNFLLYIFHWIRNNNNVALSAMFLGWLLQVLIVTIQIKINLKNGATSEFASIVYLLFQRTLFVLGTAFGVLPFLLGTPIVRPLISIQESAFWYPLARLSYGAYLSHCIFMLFRIYNVERGIWACEFDTFLFFFAYLTLAYFFSLLATVLVEIPCHKLCKEFLINHKPTHDELSGLEQVHSIAVSLGQKLAAFDNEPAEDLDKGTEFFETGLPEHNIEERLLMKEDAAIDLTFEE